MNIFCRLFGFRTGGLVKKPSWCKKNHIPMMIEPSICHMSKAQIEMLRAESGEKITYRPGSPKVKLALNVGQKGFEMKLSMLAGMVSGWLVKAWPGRPKPWIDLCGNAWTDAEVEKEVETGNVEKVFAIRLTQKGVDALKKEREI